MVMCCVHNCRNRSSTDQRLSDRNKLDRTPMRMFSFPKDPKRREMWSRAVKRIGWTPNDFSRICQDHFEKPMFIRSPLEGRWRLRHDAVPTIFEHSKPVKRRKPPTNRNKAQEEQERILYAITIDHQYSKASSTCTNDMQEPIDEILDNTEVLVVQEAPEEEVETTLPCRSCYRLKPANNVLSFKNRCLEVKLSKILNLYKCVSQRLKPKFKAKSIDRTSLKSFLNDDQIRFVSQKGKKKYYPWSKATIEKSLKLRSSCGSSGYETLLSQGFPLPSLRTLRRRTEKEIPK